MWLDGGGGKALGAGPLKKDFFDFKTLRSRKRNKLQKLEHILEAILIVNHVEPSIKNLQLSIISAVQAANLTI